MVFAQVLIFGFMLLIVLGTLVVPELRTYGTQLLALLLIFYFVLDGLRKRQRRVEVRRAVEDEETLLFLSTYLKPKLTSLIDLTHSEDNLELLRKQLQLTEREVESFLKEKEKETQ